MSHLARVPRLPNKGQSRTRQFKLVLSAEEFELLCDEVRRRKITAADLIRGWIRASVEAPL